MTFHKKLFILLILLFSFQLKAQITIDNTTYSPNQLIDGVLVPPLSGVTISNVAYQGVYGDNNKYQVGFFSTATTTLNQMGFANGIVLTTGKTSDIPAPLGIPATPPPLMDEFYIDCTPGLIQQLGTCPTFVNDLVVLADAQNYFNATILEFDFVTIHTSVTFRYVFGSEEYNNGVDSNYQCTEFNDKFGFLISGPGISGGQGFSNDARNMAILPNGSQVSINAVNDGVISPEGDSSACLLSNPDWVENVVSSEFSGRIDGTHLNGNTQILTASQSNLTPGQTYHIKLIITDVSDGSLDSVVYLEGGSFTPQQCDAGINQSICNTNSANLSANSPATGTWSVVSGTGNFTSNTSPNTQVSGLSAGANVFRWTSSDLTCFDDVTVTVNTSPVVPIVNVTAPTCTLNGSATIANYVIGQNYTFNPAGPTVASTGLISGMIFGTPYILTTGNGSCSSADTTPFSVNSILPTPAAPNVSVTAPTCSANGFSTITNYDAALNYTFNPLGPTIDSSGLVQGMVLGTSYEVTSTNSSLCTSAVSNSFVNNPMLLVPAVPLVSVTAPTCIANGLTRITNYVAGQSYIFDPVGPSVDASGLISGMAFGTSYFVSAGNGFCSSANSTSFVISQQLPLPTIISVTNNGLICVGSMATFTINASPNTQVSYTIDGNPTQTVTIDASGVGIVNVAGVMGSTTLTTVSVFDGICTSNVALSSTVNLFADTTITLVSATTTENQLRCADVTIDPIQYQVIGTATGVSVLGLPAGITHSYDAITGLLTISGATNVAGVSSYSIVTTGGCNPQATASGTITITGRPVLTYAVTNSICDGSPLDFVLSSNLPNTTFIWSATLSNIAGTFVTSGDESNINQIVTLNNSEAIGTVTIKITPYANGCSGDESEAITITVNPNPVIESVSVSDTAVCSGSNIHVDIVGNISGITYTWTAITNGVNIIGGTTSGTITATPTTTGFDLQVITSNPLVAGTIYFEVSSVRNGCTGNILQSGVVTVNPNPGLPIPSPIKTICSEEGTDLIVDVSPLILGTELTWEVLTVVNVTGANSGTGVAPVTINDILTATTNTQGYVIYRVRSSLGDCQGGYTDYRVNVNPSPRPVLTDGNICITASGEVYQTYTLNTALNDVDYDFEWFDSAGDIIAGATNSTLVVDAAGTYSVIATNWSTGCSSDPLLASATAVVTETTPATTMTVVQSEYFSDNATITVNVTGGSGSIMYSLDEGSFQSSNVFTGVSAGEHLVTVIDTEGCTYMTQEVLIIDYPTYFTPNGDGINETWNIIGLNQADAKLYIFDRYGKLLKQLSTTEASNGWDGTYNDEQLPSTDYWFTLDYTENGAAKQFKSHFSLKR
uniref:choice-of-anchor L domain-containing protein n=1 Tax=Flavobacterium sp. TaxID=239 RepID=UPI00404875EC